MTARMLTGCLTLAVWAAMALPAPAQEGTFELQDGRYVPVTPPKEGTPAGHLALIREQLQDGDESDARKLAEKFLKEYPDHPGREEAMFLAGESRMQDGRYFKAYEWFERQIDEYPAGRLLERALQREYEIADAFLRGKRRYELGFLPVPAQDDGLEILLRIAEQAPGSRWSEKALLRAADYHFDQAKYEASVDAYEQFLALHGKTSEQAPYARLQAARATYARYQGPAYNDTPLIEARQRFVDFAEAYPGRARQAGVGDVLREIEDALARKSFETGRFYARTGHPRSAALYYHRTVAKYPDSPWARRSRERLQEMDPQTVRRAIRLVQPGGAEGARLDGSTDDPSDGPADRSAPSSDGDQ